MKQDHKIKLIGFDLDGTLFTDDKRVTEVTRQAIKEAAERGIFIVPVTGRPLTAVPENVRSLPGVRYVITASGSVVYDLKEDRYLRHDLIAPELMEKIIYDLRKNDMVCMIFVDGIGYVDRENFERAIGYAPDPAGKKYMRENRTPVDDIVNVMAEKGQGVEKFTVNMPSDEKGDLIGLDKALGILSPYEDSIHEVYGGNINLEVGDKEADKGRALLWLARYLGIEKEEVMALGDSGNDLDMAVCGLFVAVENATDKIKAAADHITLSNENDGVAAAIRRFVLKEG